MSIAFPPNVSEAERQRVLALDNRLSTAKFVVTLVAFFAILAIIFIVNNTSAGSTITSLILLAVCVFIGILFGRDLIKTPRELRQRLHELKKLSDAREVYASPERLKWLADDFDAFMDEEEPDLP